MTTIAMLLDSIHALLCTIAAEGFDGPEWESAWILGNPGSRSEYGAEWNDTVADARTMLLNRSDMEARGFYAGTDAEWQELADIIDNPVSAWMEVQDEWTY